MKLKRTILDEKMKIYKNINRDNNSLYFFMHIIKMDIIL